MKDIKNCKSCFHYKACKDVAHRNGYTDINYTSNECKNYISSIDVVNAIRVLTRSVI